MQTILKKDFTVTKIYRIHKVLPPVNWERKKTRFLSGDDVTQLSWGKAQHKEWE